MADLYKIIGQVFDNEITQFTASDDWEAIEIFQQVSREKHAYWRNTHKLYNCAKYEWPRHVTPNGAWNHLHKQLGID